MSKLTNPTVFVTRPLKGSEAFLAALRDVAGPFVPVLNPAFELIAVPHEAPTFDAAVFTSRPGVSFAPSGQGRVAWCVGKATAQAAQAAGYEPQSAAGDAMDLVTLILERKPSGKLMHLRGENVRENVTQHLKGGGIGCDEVIVYRKNVLSLSVENATAVAQATDVVFPAFSAETVSIFASWGVSIDSFHVVAMSDHVAQAARELGARSVHVADHPDLSEMVALCSRLIA